jgi:hypothetical protein
MMAFPPTASAIVIVVGFIAAVIVLVIGFFIFVVI